MDIIGLQPATTDGIPSGLTRVDYRSAVDGAEDWALVLPPERGRTWLVCVHGHGSHGDQYYMRPDLVERWLPLLRGTGCGLLTPNARDNAWMSPPAAADLHALLEYVRQEYGAERFVLFGGSMGGSSVLAYAVLHPEDAVGVAAICPATDIGTYHGWCRRQAGPPVLEEIASAIEAAYGGTPQERPDVYARHSCLANAARLTMPVYVAHGDADETIPVEQSRALHDALGEDILKYHECPGGGHDMPLIAPILREALEWVLPRP